MREAIACAGIAAEDIHYVEAHASATLLNDRTEVLAIRQALGSHEERVPVSGMNGLHGHALGASGAIEMAVAVLAIHHGVLLATANCEHLDSACDLDVIRGQGRRMRPRYALCNSFGFGGINAALVLRAVN